MFIVPSSPAIRLTTNECGPATLTTTGAVTVSPVPSVTPVTRPPACSTAVTSVEKRNSPPTASAARWRLWVDSCGSDT